MVHFPLGPVTLADLLQSGVGFFGFPVTHYFLNYLAFWPFEF